MESFANSLGHISAHLPPTLKPHIIVPPAAGPQIYFVKDFSLEIQSDSYNISM